jgi:hypothetical protein
MPSKHHVLLVKEDRIMGDVLFTIALVMGAVMVILFFYGLFF